MVALKDSIVPLAALDQPRVEESLLARARNASALELYQIIRGDFGDALLQNVQSGSAPSARRALIRCFGSFIDGLSFAMRTVAVNACEFHGKDYNRFLHAKSQERGLPAYNRIFNSYRIVQLCLPRSPLAQVTDQRWDNLHTCLEIRNRVVHPECPADLGVSDTELQLIAQTGSEFMSDFQIFAQWQGQRQQRLGWEAPGQRRRDIPKTGRNEKCPCGSQRKYKNCCAAAQYAA